MRSKFIPMFLSMILALIASGADGGILDWKGDCGFEVTIYRVEGDAGQSFSYGGRTFEIPMHGAIEILAKKAELQIRTEERVIDLNERDPDQFGIVHVDLEAMHRSELGDPDEEAKTERRNADDSRSR